MKSILNKIYISLFCYFLIMSQGAEAKITLIDRVIAVVDSSVIMESELNSRFEEIIGRLRENNTELPPRKILEEQVLERLIIEEIQLQIGERAGIKISDTELNRSLSVMASQNNLNLEDFKESLENEGVSYRDIRETIRKEMIMQRVQRGKVGPKIDISDQEIENFLNSVEGKSKLAEQYNMQQILISLKSNAKPEEVRNAELKAQKIISEYEQGENFSKLAATYSSDQNALEGGSLGWRTVAELPSLFSDQVTNLKIGEISGLIRSGAGFHIVRLAEKRGETVRFEDQTHVRHILVKQTEIRTDLQTKILIDQIYEQLKNGSNFKELARQHSEDPGSKLEGGDLGWNSKNSFDPAFEEMMNKTEIDKISQPFKTGFGWHILEVLGRRNEDVSGSVRKNKAYQIIFNRKFEQELQRALIEMRAEAYVDIKLDS